FFSIRAHRLGESFCRHVMGNPNPFPATVRQMNYQGPAGAKSEILLVFQALDAVPVHDSAVDQAPDGSAADAFGADGDVPGQVSVEIDDLLTGQKRIKPSQTYRQWENQNHQ